ncbi:MAG: UvrD-helicase domain-containing protein, partial [Emergencia sp.]|nr:UvrD-helicase domain-containing protein [Emergencia sp.]
MSLDRLNAKQKEAAMQLEGPLLILAGAGSGKTSTMTERIAYMVEQGISPYHILAVTFTNKAASEMRSRVEDLVGHIDDMWIMTFHSMCLRMLRYHCEIIGYDHNFVIYDGTDQKTVIKNIIKAQNINDKEFSAPYLLSIISSCKEKAMNADAYRRTMEDNFKNKVIYNAFKAYEEELKKNNAMDFDDLLLNTVKLFEADEAVLLKYQNRFRYIMVDEYQDTNHIQYRLIKMLAESHHNLCVVGDDDQCIYQWRGADIRNILDFEKDFPEAKVIKLEQNYRSAGNILAAAHSVIENNRTRKGKKLWTEKEAGDKIKYYRADTE